MLKGEGSGDKRTHCAERVCSVKAEGISGKVYKMKRSGRMVTEENLAHCGEQLRSL